MNKIFKKVVDNLKINNDRMVKALVAVVIIVAVVAVVMVSFVSASEKPLKVYIDSMERQDASAVMKYVPEKVRDYLDSKCSEDFGSYEEYLSYAFSFTTEILSEDANEEEGTTGYGLGDNIRVSYKVNETVNIKGDDFDNFVKIYKENGIDINITEAKTFYYDVTYSGDDGSQEASDSMITFKADGKWYVDLIS